MMTRWSIVMMGSMVFTLFHGIGRADVTYFGFVGCTGASTLGTQSPPNATTPQTVTQGCYINNHIGAYANAIAAANYYWLGESVSLAPIANTSGNEGADAFWDDPNATIANTGLPNGTPLTVDLVSAVVGSQNWSLPDNGVFTSTFTYEMFAGNGPGNVNVTTIRDCGLAVPSGSGCTDYGDDGTISVILGNHIVVDTTAGADFGLEVDFGIEATEAASGGGLEDNFFDPVTLVSVTVTDALTGQVLPNAVLVGSNGPVPLGTVPEPSFLALVGTALVGMALLARKKLSKGTPPFKL